MNTSRVDKLIAHAEYLLDRFVGLSARHAMLDPMLDSPEIREFWGVGDRGTGFQIIRTTFFLSCAMEIANLASDPDRRTPSIKKLVKALDDKGVRDRLREMFAVRSNGSLADLPDELREAMAEAERRDEDARREEFDNLVQQLTSGWSSLRKSKTLQTCQTLRDKVIAHAEIRYEGSEYSFIDVKSLGLKWRNLRKTISELRELVGLITLVFRAASFDFEMLDDQLTKASCAFWRPDRDPVGG